jgi:hypothetical protein
MNETYEPPYAHWRDLFACNVSLRPDRDEKLGKERVVAIRERLVALAESHTTKIRDAAVRCGISDRSLPTVQRLSSKLIVMAGHQPVVYHPGLLCKAQALAQFAAETNSTPINIVIDTDEGDGGAVVWPRVSQDGLELRRGTVAEEREGSSLYLGQRVASVEKVAQVFAEMEADLVQSGLTDAASRAQRAGALYQQLTGEPIPVAHTVVRWALDGSATLEVPLSVVVQETEIRSVLREFVGDAKRFSGVYNSCLESYRKDHRIHNPANPFPNMRNSDEGTELPLWRIQQGARVPLYVQGEIAPVDEGMGFLVPRGSITTMLLRGFCSDLFIHGLGGGKYDRFVDQFAAAYLALTLPAYVVASRTLQLFPDKVTEMQRSLELASKFKEIASKTEAFLGQGIFSVEEESVLRRLTAERNSLRESLQRAASAEEKSAASHGLNAANREVRALLERSGLQNYVMNAAANEAALARWSFREFPFFLYRLPRSA